MKHDSEHRHNKRKQCSVPVDGKPGAEFDATHTVDISEEGLGLVSKNQVFVNEKIVVALQFDPKTDPVLTVGQVKWVEKIPEAGTYRVGMQLLNEKDVVKEVDNFLL